MSASAAAAAAAAASAAARHRRILDEGREILGNLNSSLYNGTYNCRGNESDSNALAYINERLVNDVNKSINQSTYDSIKAQVQQCVNDNYARAVQESNENFNRTMQYLHQQVTDPTSPMMLFLYIIAGSIGGYLLYRKFIKPRMMKRRKCELE